MEESRFEKEPKAASGALPWPREEKEPKARMAMDCDSRSRESARREGTNTRLASSITTA